MRKIHHGFIAITILLGPPVSFSPMRRSLEHRPRNSLNLSIRRQSRVRRTHSALRLRSSSAQRSATDTSASSNNAPLERMSAEHNPSMKSSPSSYSQRYCRNGQAKKLSFRLKSNRVSVGNPLHRRGSWHETDVGVATRMIYSHEARANGERSRPSVGQGRIFQGLGDVGTHRTPS
jgi:hypothetical protein